MRLIRIFTLVVIGLYVLITSLSAATMFQARALSYETHARRMNPTAAEPGRTPPAPLPASGDFASVRIGTYFEDIDNLSIKDSVWSTRFYIWFSWKGDAKLDPGGRFVIVLCQPGRQLAALLHADRRLFRRGGEQLSGQFPAPPSGSFGLVDHIAGIGLFTIFIAVLVSLLSCY